MRFRLETHHSIALGLQEAMQPIWHALLSQPGRGSMTRSEERRGEERRRREGEMERRREGEKERRREGKKERRRERKA